MAASLMAGGASSYSGSRIELRTLSGPQQAEQATRVAKLTAQKPNSDADRQAIEDRRRLKRAERLRENRQEAEREFRKKELAALFARRADLQSGEAGFAGLRSPRSSISPGSLVSQNAVLQSGEAGFAGPRSPRSPEMLVSQDAVLQSGEAGLSGPRSSRSPGSLVSQDAMLAPGEELELEPGTVGASQVELEARGPSGQSAEITETEDVEIKGQLSESLAPEILANAQETQETQEGEISEQPEQREALQSELENGKVELCEAGAEVSELAQALGAEAPLQNAEPEHGGLKELLSLKETQHNDLLSRNEKLQQELHSYQQIRESGQAKDIKTMQRLESTLERLLREVTFARREVVEQRSRTEEMHSEVRFLAKQIRAMEGQRREIQNSLQDLKGNIRVVCRVRDVPRGTTGIVVQTLEPNKVELSHNGDVFTFGFDRVFGMESTQSEVFDEVDDLVQSALEGFKVCIFAYGQSGSGKTYTMEGGRGAGNHGLIQRSIGKVFEEAQKMRCQGWAWTMSLSVLEVYNNSLHDLLCDSGGSGNSGLYEIKHSDEWGTVVTNATTVEVASVDQISALTAKASARRASNGTALNGNSSRSHMIVALYLRGCSSALGSELYGALHLVDLAGSETVHKSLASGDRLRETQSINKSLSSLSNVFVAKASGSTHIPFRNSKLTYLLKPCLSGKGKTLMIVNVRPESSNSLETLSTLRFARRAKGCHMGGTPERCVKSTIPPPREPSSSSLIKDRHSVAEARSGPVEAARTHSTSHAPPLATPSFSPILSQRPSTHTTQPWSMLVHCRTGAPRATPGLFPRAWPVAAQNSTARQPMAAREPPVPTAGSAARDFPNGRSPAMHPARPCRGRALHTGLSTRPGRWSGALGLSDMCRPYAPIHASLGVHRGNGPARI